MHLMVAQRLAALVDGLSPRALVAFDGPDAAGKTSMADEVARLVRRPHVRASLDGFHRPPAKRHNRGQLSPDGYYLDTFDNDAFRQRLLQPFAAGSPTVTTAIYDHRTEHAMEPAVATADNDAVLLVDGVFLQRPELCDLWTLRIYLHVPEEVTLARALDRDLDAFGSSDAVVERYRARYLPAQARYRAEVNPAERAHIVVDNTDATKPTVTKWQPPS